MALQFKGGKAVDASKARALLGPEYTGKLNQIGTLIREILDADRRSLNMTPSMHGKLVQARTAINGVHDEILGMQGGNG